MVGEEEEGNDLETGRIRTTLSYAGEGRGPGLKGMLLSIVQGVLGLKCMPCMCMCMCAAGMCAHLNAEGTQVGVDEGWILIEREREEEKYLGGV